MTRKKIRIGRLQRRDTWNHDDDDEASEALVFGVVLLGATVFPPSPTDRWLGRTPREETTEIRKQIMTERVNK